MISNSILINNISIFIIFLCFAIILFYFLNKITNVSSITFKDYPQKPNLILLYLNKYFIKNIYYTIWNCCLYFFFKVSILFYLRYSYLGQEIVINNRYPQINYEQLPYFIVIVFLLIFVLMSFYWLLDLLFFHHVLTLYLYIKNTEIFSTFLYYFINYSLKDLWGPIYLFFDCIYRLTPKPHDYYYNDHYIYSSIYNNKIISKLTVHFIYLAENHRSIFWLFTTFRQIFHLFYLYFHFQGVGYYLNILLFFCIILYDFYCLRIYYTFYYFFIFYLINLFHKYDKFEMTKDPLIDFTIYKYFYCNSVDYKKQYVDLLNKNIIISFSKENKDLLTILNDENNFKYILNNFQHFYEDPYKNINYITFNCIFKFIFNIVLTIFVINNGETVNEYLFFILCAICNIICIQQIYKKIDFKQYRYDVIFWVITLLQIYLFWLILIKPAIIFMDTEILLEIPHIIKITKVYTIEEKIMYLFQYFEYCINSTDFVNKEYFRHILRQIDFTVLICDKTTLKDIQVYVLLLLDTGMFEGFIMPKIQEIIMLKIEYEINQEKRLLVDKNIGCFITIINMWVFKKFSYYLAKKLADNIGLGKVLTDKNTFNLLLAIMDFINK